MWDGMVMFFSTYGSQRFYAFLKWVAKVDEALFKKLPN